MASPIKSTFVHTILLLLSAISSQCRGFSTSPRMALTAPEKDHGDRIVLWNSGVCPFAQRPWIALLEKGARFEHRIIDLSDKPPEFLEKYSRASGRPYGAGLVPLLEHEDRLVVESEVVAEYVARNVAGRDGMGGGLCPKDEGDEALIESFLISWRTVVDCYYDILRATSEAEVEMHKLSYMKSLESVEDLLKERGDGNFLLGSEFSYAECIAGPWIQRFYVTLVHFRAIDFEGEILSGMEYVSKWMEAVRNQPSVVASKCPEEEMIAACERYYVSYVSPGSAAFL